ncbi:hypothetical protein V8F20_001811 [Naviculisporaceae sp. PSN 640]
MPRNLRSLPVEILHQICETLDESDPSSVLSFALTCKQFHAIAESALVGTIKLEVDKPSSIARQVFECIHFLNYRGEETFRKVRRVIITGECDYYDDDDTDGVRLSPLELSKKGYKAQWHLHTPPSALWQGNYNKLHGYLPAGNDMLFPDEDTPPGPQYPDISRVEAVWRPLARLLSRFPGLTHLEFDCASPLPPSILVELENRSRRPLLSMGKFGIHYASNTNSGREQVAPYDLAVLTSPCLHRLSFAYHVRGWSDPIDLNITDIVGTLLSYGLAPKLQEIRYSPDFVWPVGNEQENEEDEHDEEQDGDEADDDEDDDGDSEDQPTQFLHLLPKSNRNSRHPSDLRCLEICSFDTMTTDWQFLYITESILERLGMQTTHLGLRTLKLSQPVDLDAVIFLADWAPSTLTHLTSACDPRLFKGTIDNGQYLSQVRGFISNQHKLASLEIIGWNHLAEPFVSGEPGSRDFRLCLPKTLHTLLFTSSAIYKFHHCIISVEEIICLARFCPRIQDLSLILRRSMGDSTEVAQYRAIGLFPKLRNLTLTLDSPPRILRQDEYNAVPYPFSQVDQRDYSFEISLLNLDHWNSKPERVFDHPFRRNGAIYEFMVNHALDEKLARSIFQTIFWAQWKIHSDETQTVLPFGSLQHMLIRTTGEKSFEHEAKERFLQEIDPFALSLSKAFSVKLNKLGWAGTVSDPGLNLEKDLTLPLSFREIGRRSEYVMELRSQWHRMVGTGPGELLPFRRVWSRKRQEWWDDWESFPLQLDE